MMSQTNEAQWEDSLSHLAVHTPVQDFEVSLSSPTDGERSAFAPPQRRSSDGSSTSASSTLPPAGSSTPEDFNHSTMHSQEEKPIALPPANSHMLLTLDELLQQPSTSDSLLSPVSEAQPSVTTPTTGAGFTRAPGLGPPSSEVNTTAATAAFVCSICGFSCGSKFHYNSHMNTHGDHKCSMCDYQSRTEGRLKKHMRESHTLEQQLAAGLEVPAPTAQPTNSSPQAMNALSSYPTNGLTLPSSSSPTAALSLSLSFSTPSKDSANSASSGSSSGEVIDVTSLPPPPPPPSQPSEVLTSPSQLLSELPPSLSSTLLGIINSQSSGMVATPSALEQMKVISEHPLLRAGSPASTMGGGGATPLSLPAALNEMGLMASSVSTNGGASAPSSGTRRSKQKTYKCKQCPLISLNKEDQWAHARTHIPPEKQMSCPNCNFVTEYKHHLEYHIRNHLGSKPFQCKKCVYTCVNKSMLNSHMKSHTNVYQFRCRDCTYATKYCHSLKLHLKKYNHTRRIDGPEDEQMMMDSPMPMKEESSPEMEDSLNGGSSLPSAFSSLAAFTPIVSSASLSYAHSVLLRQHQLDQMNSLMGSLQSQLRCTVCEYLAPSHEDLVRHNMVHLLSNPPSSAALAAAASSLYSQLPPQPTTPSALTSGPFGSSLTAAVLQQHATKWNGGGGEDDDTNSPCNASASTGSPAGSKSSDEDRRQKSKKKTIDEISDRLREKTSPEIASSPSHPSNGEMEVEEAEEAIIGPPSDLAPHQPSSHEAMEKSVEEREGGEGDLNMFQQAYLAHIAMQAKDGGGGVAWKWQCVHCRMAFMDQALYQIHMGYHGYDTAFQCNRCGHSAADALTFNLHLLQASHE